MPEVWFIRHGESIANIGRATRTVEEAELTARGRDQAWLVADYLEREARGRSVKIIASSYKRAQQTAAYTQSRFVGSKIETWLVGEFNYLALPTSTFTTSVDRLPEVKYFWEEKPSPFFQYSTNAESFAQFISRMQSVVEKLRACQDDQLVFVFSHQQFIQAVKWRLERGRRIRICDLRSREKRRFHELLHASSMPNGAILKTVLTPSKQRVVSVCEVSHLAPIVRYASYPMQSTDVNGYPSVETPELAYV